MNSPYQKLLLICGAAEQFIVESKEATDEYQLLGILDCLLSAEDILDKGRSTLPPGASFKFEKDKQEVNVRMDTIRSGIVTLIQRIGKKEVVDLLEYRSRQGRLQWVHTLQ